MYKGNFYLQDFPATFVKVWKYRETGFPYSGIVLFSGGQGTGKTLNAVQMILDIRREYPQCRIISNTDLAIDCVEPYTGLECFEENNGNDGIIYFLDEIQNLYSSMQSKGVGDEQLYIWSQNRKNRRVIIGTTQRFTRVAKPIREQTKWLIDMRFKLFNVYAYRQYNGYNFDDDGNYCDDKPPIRFCCPSLAAYQSYDTSAVVRRIGGKLDDKCSC